MRRVCTEAVKPAKKAKETDLRTVMLTVVLTVMLVGPMRSIRPSAAVRSIRLVSGQTAS